MVIENTAMGAMIIRRALESDRIDVAKMIVCGFHIDFSKLTKELGNVEKVLENGISIERFFIAKDGEETVGVLACTDCSGRAIYINKTECRKYLGLLIGTISGVVMAAEFSKPLPYPMTTGYIEFVTVAESTRKKGLATTMLHFMMDHTDYQEYMLDVTNINFAAQNCYLKFGFVEVERVKVSLAKLKGFSSKIYMRYEKQAGKLQH